MKKILSIILCIVFSLTLISTAGCTNNNPNTGDGNTGKVMINGFENFERDVQLIRMFNEFGIIDQNSNKTFVKSGEKSLKLTPLGDRMSSANPYIMLPSASIRFEEIAYLFAESYELGSYKFKKISIKDDEEKRFLGQVSIAIVLTVFFYLFTFLSILFCILDVTLLGDIYKVSSIRDYSKNLKKDVVTGEVSEIGSPLTNCVYYELENGSFICVRPSGTEPKLKIYYSVKANNKIDADVAMKKMQVAVEALLDSLK